MTQLDYSLKGNLIHFISLGCPRNLVDSEVMLGILLQKGYEITPELTDADFIIINTCGFLQAARQESLDRIKESVAEKKEGAKVVVTGCMVQSHRKEIEENAPYIDYLLGAGHVDQIMQAIESQEKGAIVTPASSYLQVGEVPRMLSTPKHYAYLKIAEGCKKRCSYCIIPKIKGRLKSKPIEQVANEFRILLKQGVKEVILIAQDLGDYGKDTGKSGDLVALLKRLLQEEGDYWIRLLYLYPDEITPEIIDLIKNEPRICPYLDMPIQHINNTVLKAMHRKVTGEQIIETITTLRKEIPDIAIRTSLIVGFPGETEEQFEELCAFIENYPLDHVGIFKYSKEEESFSAKLPGHISEAIKEKRLNRLAEIQQKVVEQNHQKMINKRLEVIVEGYHEETELLMMGRHKGQCPDIDGAIIINDGRKVTEFGVSYLVEITDSAGYDLVGRVIEPYKRKVTCKPKRSPMSIIK